MGKNRCQSQINLFILDGNLGADPQERYTAKGKLSIQFTLGNNQVFRNEDGDLEPFTNWFDVTVYNPELQKIASSLKKGDLVTVQGNLRSRLNKDRNGVRRKSVWLIAKCIEVHYRVARSQDE